MVKKEVKLNAGEEPPVDHVVSATINSALERLQLDDLDVATPEVNLNDDLKNSKDNGSKLTNKPQSPVYPPPQMMGAGFMPYSQMMHMAPPHHHHLGFFPPPDFPESSMTQRGPVMFNNSGDSSVFPNMRSPMGSVPSFIPESHLMPNNDPLWIQSPDHLPVPSSVTIDQSISTDDPNATKTKGPGAATVRRQTFHAISTHDLIDATATDSAVNTDASTALATDELNMSTPSAVGTKTRTQSISFEKTVGHPQFLPQMSADEKNKIAESSDKEVEGKKEKVNTYAAYPYGGPLAQPNPVMSGHLPPPLPGNNPSNYGIHSPFPGAYDFNAPFQSFSPVLGGLNPPLYPQSPIHMSHSPLPLQPHGPELNGAAGPNKNNAGGPTMKGGEQMPPFPMMQHQQGGTPPPWMYGSPSPFNPMGPPHPHGMPHQGHPAMMSGNNNNNNGMQRGGRHFHGRGRNGNGNKSRFNRHDHNGNNNNNNNGQFNYDENNQRRMEEMSRYADSTLDEFVGNIYSLCKDQHGCRFLQKQLDVLGSKAADLIFEETKFHTIELMTDSFGNYLMQKLIERVTTEQRIELAKIASPQFVEIALNPHGTRALQKLIECINTEEEAKIIVESLRDSIVQLSKDLNGNHVVQKCLQKLHPTDFQFIFDATCDNCVDIATHRHGCCVLQRCLDHGTKEQCEKLCDKLLSHVDKLTLDPFGNYVVQYVITKETERDEFDYTHKIVHLLKPKVAELSVHKFGSNVIEKILRTPVVTETMILELLNHESEIQNLLNDSYGNYVLQTALDISHEHNKYLYDRLSAIVTPLLVGPIRNTPHGKRIMGILHIES